MTQNRKKETRRHGKDTPTKLRSSKQLRERSTCRKLTNTRLLLCSEDNANLEHVIDIMCERSERESTISLPRFLCIMGELLLSSPFPSSSTSPFFSLCLTHSLTHSLSPPPLAPYSHTRRPDPLFHSLLYLLYVACCRHPNLMGLPALSASCLTDLCRHMLRALTIGEQGC